MQATKQQLSPSSKKSAPDGQSDCLIISIPSSPKAKSAPATPCNVTPTAFHQHTSHLDAMLNPNPANTLPPDIRKNMTERQAATCRVLNSNFAVSGANLPTSLPAISYQYLDELFKRGQLALEAKDYLAATRFLSQCIKLATSEHERVNEFPYLKQNFEVYCKRAEAHFYLENYNEAIDDSRAAHDLNPKCTQAYYHQGRAQFCIGQYADCLAVLSFGLSQEPNNKHLFEALVDSALDSEQFKAGFEPKYNTLKSLDLHKQPFVVVSVLGQELLAKDCVQHSAIVLESALKMENKLGNANRKLISSVLSTLSYAYSLMKNYEKAISYMKEELEIETKLDNVVGQCRVLSNMGHTYYKMRNYDESIEVHRKHNNLAMRTRLYLQLSAGLNAIGHVHVARNDFTCALTSHSNCLEILKQLGDNEFAQFKELLSIGHIHTMLNDLNAAEERYNEAILLLKSPAKISQEIQHEGSVMVYFNLAYLSLKKQSFPEAKQYYEHVIKLAKLIPAPKRYLFEMRAVNGLGQAHRLNRNFGEAKVCFENQLKLAEMLKDTRGQSQALCNLGMIAQHSKEYNLAWKLFDDNLRLVDKDPLLAAYAHSYMGSIYFLTNRYSKAQEHYETSLNMFKNLDFCSAETKTIDLNMAAILERKRVGRN